ncbi:autotransporter outer membrane beta-barrel domain-containing protein [Limnohabitans sp.]|jgi:hypothetical protein|uniref:autotransporter outer membrane beta-barrel domain-containing protein n=1 Tax=Limnohabitans sp. TaxID=1907725 RepID=UPI0025B9F7DA|nr:autotransporter outer membrane beta-barrel domain-containing protein [Limnohabitans sp.]
MSTKLNRISIAVATVISAAAANAQTNYNFTNTTANTFTNGYVLSGTLSTNASNAVTAANLSISTAGGAPITFTSLPTQSGTYTRTLCGTATTFQEYRFGTGVANTLYLDVMSSQLDAALAGQLNGVHTSLLLSSGSYALRQTCDSIEAAARSSRHPKMTLNAASVVNANPRSFNVTSAPAKAVPRLVNTISSNLTQFHNRFGLGAIQKRLEQAKAEKAAKKAAEKAAKAEIAASYAKAQRYANELINKLKLEMPQRGFPDWAPSPELVQRLIANSMTRDWLSKNPQARNDPNALQKKHQEFRNYKPGKSSGDEDLPQEMLAEVEESGIEFWAQPFSSSGEQREMDNISPFKTHAYGITIGGDRKIDDRWTVGGGLMLGNSKVNSTLADAPNSTSTNMYQVMAYGQYALDDRTNLQISGSLGLNKNRNSRMTPDESTASSKYDSRVVGLGVSVSRNYELGEATTFTPSTGIDFSWQENAQINETGAGNWNVTTHKHATKQGLWNFGGQINHEVNDEWSVSVKAGASYIFHNPELTVVSAFAALPTTTFTSTGSATSPWMKTVGLGAKYTSQKGTEVNFGYDALIRDKFLNHSAHVKVKVPF